MIVEIIIALIVGIIAGTFTGLMPGIHINLIAAILVSSLGFFSEIPLEAIIVFIISLSITHTFLDFIPSIFLGAPETDSFLTVLPGHELLMMGEGPKAVSLALLGSILAIPAALILLPLFAHFSLEFQELIKIFIPFIILFTSLFLILREEKPILALAIFIFSGFLGFMAFNMPVKEPLLPLLTGLFGISGIIISIRENSSVPEQKKIELTNFKIKRSSILKVFLSGLISSPLFAFLPGTGSGQAAMLSSETKKHTREEFLMLNGMISTLVMFISFLVVYYLKKSRTGSAATILEIVKSFPKNYIFIIFSTLITVSVLSFFLGIGIANTFGKVISKINYKFLCLSVLIVIFILNIIFTNFLGLLLLIGSTSLGIFCIVSKSRRINLMGCLIIPTIFFYLFA